MKTNKKFYHPKLKTPYTPFNRKEKAKKVMVVKPLAPYSKYITGRTDILLEKTGWKYGPVGAAKWYRGHMAREKDRINPWFPWQWSVNINYDLYLEGINKTRLNSKLHAKLVKSLSGLQNDEGETEDAKGELGTTFAEYKKLFQSIEKNAKRLALAAQALRSGNFKKFLNIIDAQPLDKHISWNKCSPKIAAKLWIEYWFGIAPTIKDIQLAYRNIEKPLPLVREIVVSSKIDAVQTWRDEGTTSPILDSSIDVTVWGKSYMRFEVENPGSLLSNKLGTSVLNTFEVAVNVTPWSWLLNWFVNIQQYSKSFNAFSGVTIHEKYTTYYFKFKGTRIGNYSNVGGASGKVYRDVSGYYMMRNLELPSVGLYLKTDNPFRDKPTRAATAISLLVQRLKEFPITNAKPRSQFRAQPTGQRWKKGI